MRVKLDKNVPTHLVPILTALGHDVDTVPQGDSAESPM